MPYLRVKLITNDGTSISHKDVTFSKSPDTRPLKGDIILLKSDLSIKYSVESVTWIEDDAVEYRLNRVLEES